MRIGTLFSKGESFILKGEVSSLLNYFTSEF